MKLWRIVMTLGRSHSDLQRMSQSLAEPLGTMISKTKEENREKHKAEGKYLFWSPTE